MNVFSTAKKTIYLFNASKELVRQFEGTQACADYLKCSARCVTEALRNTRVVQGSFYVSRSQELLLKPKKVNRNVLESAASSRDSGRGGRSALPASMALDSGRWGVYESDDY